MDAAAIKKELAERAALVEAHLEGCLKACDIPPGLLEAMEYSLLGGGKRLRPVLCLTFAELFGLPAAAAMPFAAAFELIHSYSLIHDDLPAMDDDDLRRGKPSNHKAYGEAYAILAGDGLNTEAFRLCCEAGAEVPAGRVLEATRLLAVAAGAAGMVGGQALDMDFTDRPGVSLPELQDMHARKTGALIRAACECGAVLAGADAAGRTAAKTYGAAVGSAFQIVDDILDIVGDEATLGKPVGSDLEKNKTTYPSLLGLDASRKLAEDRVDQAVAALAAYTGPKAELLVRLARYIVERVQ
jgi:geranylgeranyl diphosphate synthase type II